MSEWKEYKLSDVADIIAGYAFRSSEFGRVGESVVKIKDINPPYVDILNTNKVDIGVYPTQKMDKYKICSGDYVIAMTGATIGKIGRMRHEGVAYINQRVAKIKAKQGIDNDFVYYAICGDSFQQFIRNNIDSNSAQENISTTSIGKFPVTLPSLEEQRRIAAILGALDDKIELNRRINANLEQQAQTLFNHWFVDFEFPNANGKPYKSSGDKFLASLLGPIPEGWEAGYYTDIIDIKGGGTPKTDIVDFWNGNIPFFSPKDVPSSCYVLNTEKYITDSGLQNCNSALYPTNTVFITARGTVGKVVMAGRDMAMNQTNYALIGKTGIGQHFVYNMTLQLVNRLLKKANGAVFNAITTRDFSSEQVVIPKYNIIESFCNRVAPIYKQVLVYNQENERLAQLRDMLLPKLMNGEMDIKGESDYL